MVVERDNRTGVIHHGRHKDFPGFDNGVIDRTATNNMDSVDLIFDIEGDNAKLLNWFGFEIEDEFEGSITGQRAGYPAAFEVIAAAFETDLFEGVDVYVGKGHKNNS